MNKIVLIYCFNAVLRKKFDGDFKHSFLKNHLDLLNRLKER